MADKKTCSVSGCGESFVAIRPDGAPLCATHWLQFLRERNAARRRAAGSDPVPAEDDGAHVSEGGPEDADVEVLGLDTA